MERPRETDADTRATLQKEQSPIAGVPEALRENWTKKISIRQRARGKRYILKINRFLREGTASSE